MQTVSLVLTTYNRYPLLEKTLHSIFNQSFFNLEVIVVDDGTDYETPDKIKQWDVKYFRLDRKRVEGLYNNPAYPINVGFRAATNDVVILQNAECKHITTNTIELIASRVDDSCAVYASTMALNSDSTPAMWYVHPTHNPRPFFFCGGLKRHLIEKLRGMDEDYLYYGMDDDDFADRLTKMGIQHTFHSDIVVHHMYHPPAFTNTAPVNMDLNREIYNRKTLEMAQGIIGVERNLNREWGKFPLANS
jgi:glycosyltransferase involved in cell wall biosynthesis